MKQLKIEIRKLQIELDTQSLSPQARKALEAEQTALKEELNDLIRATVKSPSLSAAGEGPDDNPSLASECSHSHKKISITIKRSATGTRKWSG